MNIETYEEKEISEADPVECVEHRQLAEKLGLQKQLSIHKESGHVDHYRKLTAEEIFVFQTNFPNIVKLRDHEGVIPLRVLQVIAHFLEVHPGKEILLLCPQPGKPDPVVIASQYTWQVDGDSYLLARFGSALDDFSTLRENAIREIKRRLESLGSLPWAKLNAIRGQLEA